MSRSRGFAEPSIPPTRRNSPSKITPTRRNSPSNFTPTQLNPHSPHTPTLARSSKSSRRSSKTRTESLTPTIPDSSIDQPDERPTELPPQGGPSSGPMGRQQHRGARGRLVSEPQRRTWIPGDENREDDSNDVPREANQRGRPQEKRHRRQKLE